MLSVFNLTVRYRQHLAIEDVSFSLIPGAITGLIGPNGAGKSTLVKAMLGLVPQVRGTVKYGDRPLQQQLGQVAYVPQRSAVDWDYPVTVQQVAMMGRIRHTGWLRRPSRQSREVVKNALERVGMWPYRRRRIGELSGGQQQRVFLACALATEAEIYLFDEPLAGIDKVTEGIIYDIFGELKASNKIVLVIGHDLGEFLEQCDRLLLLNRIKIAEGTGEDVMTPSNLARAYGTSFCLMQRCFPQSLHQQATA